MSRRCYTVDVNPTSSSRVKVRLYETRPTEAGGNILLLQGQLSTAQFQGLERLLLVGAGAEGAVISAVGRYYSRPEAGDASAEPTSRATGVRRKTAVRAIEPRASRIRLVEDRQPRAPGVTGPVIGLNGVVDEDDDYHALARHHVERLLRRRRA